MSNIFSKFFMSFGSNKNKYLPVGTEPVQNAKMAGSSNGISNIASSAKPLASFDLSIEKPKYAGAIPEATIKFYPLD